MDNFQKLTGDTLSHAYDLIKNKTNGFDLLVENYRDQTDSEIDFSDVVSRLQTQYFILSNTNSNLKTQEEWNQNEIDELSDVNYDIPAISNKKYSSFALKEHEQTFDLPYVLDDDYASSHLPFKNKDMSDARFSATLKALNMKFGIKVKQNNFYSDAQYKKGFAYRAIIKIAKIFKIAKPKSVIKSKYNGTVKLPTYVNGYKVSNTEKTIKIFDHLSKIAMKSILKQNKIKLSKAEIYASRLFCDILTTRVTDFGKNENNEIAEKCLWLKFSNLLNTHNFISEQLKTIVDIGTKTAVKLCEDMDLTADDIYKRMNARGFVYNSIPTNLTDALLNAKEKSYDKYFTEIVKSSNFAQMSANNTKYTTQKEFSSKDNLKLQFAQNEQARVLSDEEAEQVLKRFKMNDDAKINKDDAIDTKEVKVQENQNTNRASDAIIMGHHSMPETMPNMTKFEDLQKSENTDEQKEINDQEQKTIQEFFEDRINSSEQQENIVSQESQEVISTTKEKAQAVKDAEKSYFDWKAYSKQPSSNSTRTKNSIAKKIDKEIEKIVHNKALSIGKNLVIKKYSGKKEKVANAQYELLCSLSIYYKNMAAGKDISDIVKENMLKQNINHIKFAMHVSELMFDIRNLLTVEVLERLDEKPENVTSKTFINKVCRKITGKNESDRYSVSNYFTEIINTFMEYYLKEYFASNGQVTYEDISDNIEGFIKFKEDEFKIVEKTKTGKLSKEVNKKVSDKPKINSIGTLFKNTQSLTRIFKKSKNQSQVEQTVQTKEEQSEQKPYEPNFVLVNDKERM